MLDWFRKKKSTPAGDGIKATMINLTVAGEQSLFIMLGADGSITRLGTGAVDNAERDLFVGVTDSGPFEQLRRTITPELLAWCGQSRRHPEPAGKLCELAVGFVRATGEEILTAWQYGSESQGPPPELVEFVRRAVEATNPWFREQQAIAERGNT